MFQVEAFDIRFWKFSLACWVVETQTDRRRSRQCEVLGTGCRGDQANGDVVTATFRLHFIFITSSCELVTRVLRATFAPHLSKAEVAGENCNTGEKFF